VLDLEAVKGRLAKANEPGNPWRDSWATRDIAALVAEVERLREDFRTRDDQLTVARREARDAEVERGEARSLLASAVDALGRVAGIGPAGQARELAAKWLDEFSAASPAGDTR
jgi:hypothetical protein